MEKIDVIQFWLSCIEDDEPGAMETLYFDETCNYGITDEEDLITYVVCGSLLNQQLALYKV